MACILQKRSLGEGDFCQEFLVKQFIFCAYVIGSYDNDHKNEPFCPPSNNADNFVDAIFLSSETTQ